MVSKASNGRFSGLDTGVLEYRYSLFFVLGLLDFISELHPERGRLGTASQGREGTRAVPCRGAAMGMRATGWPGAWYDPYSGILHWRKSLITIWVGYG